MLDRLFTLFRSTVTHDGLVVIFTSELNEKPEGWGMDLEFHHTVGDRLDDFEIVEPLYAGALAQVYRAIDTLTLQTVVIKVPSLDIVNNPLVYYHFQNELQVLAGVRHPRIVRLIHRDRSTAYSIFEYIPGMDLRKRIDTSAPLPLLKAKHYIVQTAEALDYLHSCGILHLDIKPENLIITPMDTVKIVDFGLARRLGDQDVLQEDFTRPHGTPYYAAPEQLERYRDEPRTDLYSLTLVYYEMLTGRLPFRKSKDLNKVRRRLKVAPLSPRQFRNDLPRQIEDFILKALNRDPELRHASARDYIHALERCHDSTSAGPIEADLHEDVATVTGACAIPARSLQSSVNPNGIIAAVQDNDQAEQVVEAALEEAVTTGMGVILLTVVSGNQEDDWTRYTDEVSGKEWGRRLEKYAQRFRHYGIDPVVRIRSGHPVEVIVETAKAAKADVIVLGPSGESIFKRWFGGSTVARILKQAPCRVLIAEETYQPFFPHDAEVSALTAVDLRKIDYFLVALWTQQLNWLAAVVQGLMSEPLISRALSLEDNPVNRWLEQIRTHKPWRFLAQFVESTQSSLDSVVAEMVAAVRIGDEARLRSLYLKDAMALLCRLREGLRMVSTALREQSTIIQFQRAHLLEQSLCPIDSARLTSAGPLRQIQAIREYFCAHPDASPDQCLGWLERESPLPPSEGMDS